MLVSKVIVQAICLQSTALSLGSGSAAGIHASNYQHIHRNIKHCQHNPASHPLTHTFLNFALKYKNFDYSHEEKIFDLLKNKRKKIVVFIDSPL